MSRIGKIARLPRDIREQLNHRLQEGQSGTDILHWLNALPECQQVLTQKFSGRPIDDGNLSQWRHGGYQDWLQDQAQRQRLERLEKFFRRAVELDDLGTERDLGDRLAQVIAAELAEAINALETITDPNERWCRLREISRELSRLRRENSNDQRLRLAEQRREFEMDEFSEKSMRAKAEENRTKALLAMLGPTREHEAFARSLGFGKDSKKWADLLHRAATGLPMPDWWTAQTAKAKNSPSANLAHPKPSE